MKYVVCNCGLRFKISVDISCPGAKSWKCFYLRCPACTAMCEEFIYEYLDYWPDKEVEYSIKLYKELNNSKELKLDD